MQRILKEHGVNFVQTVWQEGAAQPARLPDDDVADEAAEPAAERNEDARGLRGKETERRAPRLGDDTELDTAAPAAAEVSREDRHKLQAVLHELSECRRLLDGVLR